MAFTELLISKADVYRRVDATADGMGASSDAGLYTELVAEAVPCRVTKQSTRARFAAKVSGKDVIVDTLTIFTDCNDLLHSRDRFIVDGLFYDTEDRYVAQDSEGPHHLEFTAQRVS